MAREEQDRENLLRDAIAFRQRAEWRASFCPEPVFVGFRADGAASFYFGQDEVYHLTSNGELRRGFLQGKLLKAQACHLVEMTRHRTEGEVQLRSRQLSPEEESQTLQRLQRQLQALQRALLDNSAQLNGEVKPEADVAGQSTALRVLAWLEQIPEVTVAKSLRR